MVILKYEERQNPQKSNFGDRWLYITLLSYSMGNGARGEYADLHIQNTPVSPVAAPLYLSASQKDHVCKKR